MGVKAKYGKSTLVIGPSNGIATDQISFTPKETGVYTITLSGIKNGDEVVSQINYSLYNSKR